jgi:hypothetical protein
MLKGNPLRRSSLAPHVKLQMFGGFFRLRTFFEVLGPGMVDMIDGTQPLGNDHFLAGLGWCARTW